MNRSGYKFIDGLKERFSVSLSLVCCFVMQWFRLICFLCKTSRGVLTLQFIQERPFFVYLDLYQSIYAVCFFYEFWGQATFFVWLLYGLFNTMGIQVLLLIEILSNLKLNIL